MCTIEMLQLLRGNKMVEKLLVTSVPLSMGNDSKTSDYCPCSL